MLLRSMPLSLACINSNFCSILKRHLVSKSGSSTARLRLLNAVQNLSDGRRLRCFPLRHNEIQDPPKTPTDFHRLLCHLIQKSSKRVQLASLYIGTASSEKAHSEIELLQSIRSAASRNVPVRILMDANRGLRPVTVSQDPNKTISSAHVCHETLASTPSNQSSGVFLFPVLSSMLQSLPNPLNEIAGVFHIKVYLIDDDLVLSGANLSHEYFTTRIDRYLHLRSNDVAQFYSDLFDVLCTNGAVQYPSTDRNDLISKRRDLQKSLEELFAPHPDNAALESDDDCNNIVAYAVPTFQAPRNYFPTTSCIDHERALQRLLFEASALATAHSRNKLCARIATAYLNPTPSFLETLASTCVAWFLTAGRISHGFAPKNPSDCVSHNENVSRDWRIPNAFVHAAQQVVKMLQRLEAHRNDPTLSASRNRISFYQRPGWTFHAKGLWLSIDNAPYQALLSPSADLWAVTHGSGNFGERSATRDMESNLLLVFSESPHSSPLVQQHVEEWNRLCQLAKEEPDVSPPLWIRLVFPWVRSFF